MVVHARSRNVFFCVTYRKVGANSVGAINILHERFDADEGGLVDVAGTNQPVVPMLITMLSRE